MVETEGILKAAEYEERIKALQEQLDGANAIIATNNTAINGYIANEGKLNGIIARNLLTREAPAEEKVPVAQSFDDLYKAVIAENTKE